MALLLLLFFCTLLNYLQYEASPFYKNFNNKIINKQLYTTTIRTVHYLHYGSSFAYRLCIACNYLHTFSLSSYTCFELLAFATVLHPVMGIWIARCVTNVPLSFDGYLDCLDCWVGQLAADARVVCLLMFSCEKKHFFV